MGTRMISTFLVAVFKAAFPLLCIVALFDLLTMSRPRRVRMLRRQGLTWAAIASRFNCSPSTARRWALA